MGVYRRIPVLTLDKHNGVIIKAIQFYNQNFWKTLNKNEQYMCVCIYCIYIYILCNIFTHHFSDSPYFLKHPGV